MSTSKLLTMLNSLVSTLVIMFKMQPNTELPANHFIEKEERHRLRHCPKSPDELSDVYVTLHKTFKGIEDTDLFRTLLNEMQYAKMPLCKCWTEQHALPAVPNELDAPFETTIVTGTDRVSYTVWVLWFNDRVEVVKPYPNRGIYRSNCEELEYRETADVMPVGVIKAAKVTIGVVESDNMLKGYQWLLYQDASEA